MSITDTLRSLDSESETLILLETKGANTTTAVERSFVSPVNMAEREIYLTSARAESHSTSFDNNWTR
jgi:hypothetical protein